MDGLIDQLAGEAGSYKRVSAQNVDIGDLQNLFYNLFDAHAGRQSTLGTGRSAVGTQHLFPLA
jgi:hypothetical protein